MTAHLQTLLDQVHEAGGRLLMNGDKLRVEAPAPLPDDLVEQLKAAKPALIDMLTEGEPDARTGANVVLLAVPDGVPEQWAQGVADLLSRVRPAAWSEDRWTALREDAFAFLRDHGAEAAGLGWNILDLFGAHLTQPLACLDCMGLVVLLRGRRVVELHHDRAVIENQQGKRTSFTRHPSRRRRIPVWELDQSRGHAAGP